MLAIKIEYLTGVCMATRHDDPSRAKAEWPPHPDRFFSALVAAASHLQDGASSRGEETLPDAALRALRWLEQQSWADEIIVGPHLWFSEAGTRLAPEVYMPSNPHPSEIPGGALDTGDEKTQRKKRKAVLGLLPVHRHRSGLPIPSVTPDEPVVYFIWPDSDPSDHISVLRKICENVTYLGRSRSLVHASIDEDPPAPTHVPDALGQVQLRVPGPGRLDYLIEKHKRDGGKPDPSPPQRYAMRSQGIKKDVVASVFDRVFVFRPSRRDPAIGTESTLKLTETFRKAVLAHAHAESCGCNRWKDRVPLPAEAQGCYEKIPPLISGHCLDGSALQSPHLAFVALPFVDSHLRHADGSIKGVAVLVPRTENLDALLPVAKSLSQVQANGLGIPGIGTWNLAEVPADDPPLRTLQLKNWQGPSRHWTTVTPMAFGHFPKPKNGGEPQVILDSLEMVGIDPQHVIEIAVSRHSSLHGVPPSWFFKSFRESKPKTNARRMLRHVTLRFDRPVKGPIIIGCKRYFGLGLMRPLEER